MATNAKTAATRARKKVKKNVTEGIAGAGNYYGEVFGGDVEGEEAGGDVEGDEVAVADEGEGGIFGRGRCSRRMTRS